MKGLKCQAEGEDLALQVVGVPDRLKAGKRCGKNLSAAVGEVPEGHRVHEAPGYSLH